MGFGPQQPLSRWCDRVSPGRNGEDVGGWKMRLMSAETFGVSRRSKQEHKDIVFMTVSGIALGAQWNAKRVNKASGLEQ